MQDPYSKQTSDELKKTSGSLTVADEIKTDASKWTLPDAVTRVVGELAPTPALNSLVQTNKNHNQKLKTLLSERKIIQLNKEWKKVQEKYPKYKNVLLKDLPTLLAEEKEDSARVAMYTLAIDNDYYKLLQYLNEQGVPTHPVTTGHSVRVRIPPSSLVGSYSYEPRTKETATTIFDNALYRSFPVDGAEKILTAHAHGMVIPPDVVKCLVNRTCQAIQSPLVFPQDALVNTLLEICKQMHTAPTPDDLQAIMPTLKEIKNPTVSQLQAIFLSQQLEKLLKEKSFFSAPIKTEDAKEIKRHINTLYDLAGLPKGTIDIEKAVETTKTELVQQAKKEPGGKLYKFLLDLKRKGSFNYDPSPAAEAKAVVPSATAGVASSTSSAPLAPHSRLIGGSLPVPIQKTKEEKLQTKELQNTINSPTPRRTT